MVFVSHKYHCVGPVDRGTRCVLIVEFWAGPPKCCAHRCLCADANFECPYDFRTYIRESMMATVELSHAGKVPSASSALLHSPQCRHPRTATVQEAYPDVGTSDTESTADAMALFCKETAKKRPDDDY